MKNKVLPCFLLLLLPAVVPAQESVTVKGRIINGRGEAVEYVQMGVPRLQIGTISTVDGRFEIEVPPDTLQFFHVSYQPACFPVSGPADDVVIVLEEQELPPAVLIGGNTKEKYLVRPGTSILKNTGVINTTVSSERPVGRELGSVAQTGKPFLVNNIQFTVRSNSIPGCVAAVNIYRIEGRNESFENVLHKPIYIDVALSDSPQDFDIRPDETILLEPGRYFIAFQIVGYDEQALHTFLTQPEEVRDNLKMTMEFNVYLKKSYLREAALGKMDRFPVNIGISVKGLEYQ
ncbi:MAG: carboxypeptidase-like regulatory domain-containing protein [Bacteroidales bacterium]|nr:carboxypeptidase-like regulatory domain-containing protein [Bacteroidales bacterium]